MDTESLDELLKFIETPIEYDLFLKYLEDSYKNEEISVEDYNELKKKLKEKESVKNQRYVKPGEVKEIICYKGYFDKKEKVNVDYTPRITEFYREAMKKNKTLYDYMNEIIGIPSKMQLRFVLKNEVTEKKENKPRENLDLKSIKERIDSLEMELKKLRDDLEKIMNKNQ